MNKKILVPVLIITTLFIFFVGLAIIQYRTQRPILSELIPLIPRPSPTQTIITPSPTPTGIPGVPSAINTETAFATINASASAIEKEKIIDYLPYRVENFPTTSGLRTTINIYTLLSDPRSTIRLEIYNVNFNNQLTTGRDAIAFRDSFLEAKKFLSKWKVNLSNMQIIYGNRQYIQNTATYWVNTFNLLD